MSWALLPNFRVVLSTYTYFVVLLVSLATPFIYHAAKSSLSSNWQVATIESIMQAGSIMSDSSHLKSLPRTPIYFLSIGGPNFMENTKHPAYAKMAAIGREITMKIKPKAVVVFSAHWQDGPNKISVNVAEQTDIIYDFYGFPEHYYEYKYPNKGSPEVAERVIEKLAQAGVEVEIVKRGLDHGVWAGFIVGKLWFSCDVEPFGIFLLIFCPNSIQSKDESIECTDCTGFASQ